MELVEQKHCRNYGMLKEGEREVEWIGILKGSSQVSSPSM